MSERRCGTVKSDSEPKREGEREQPVVNIGLPALELCESRGLRSVPATARTARAASSARLVRIAGDPRAWGGGPGACARGSAKDST